MERTASIIAVNERPIVALEAVLPIRELLEIELDKTWKSDTLRCHAEIWLNHSGYTMAGDFTDLRLGIYPEVCGLQSVSLTLKIIGLRRQLLDSSLGSKSQPTGDIDALCSTATFHPQFESLRGSDSIAFGRLYA